MPSKTETSPSFVNTFETQEAKKPNHKEGSLRDELLSAPERRGNGVFIPMGTVAVEGNSRALTPESFFENSNNVAKLREKQNYLTGNVEGNATRLRGGRSMSRLDREFTSHQEEEPNGNNLTFLYDEKATVAEDELHVPSAVLVHEKLSEEEIAQLRETLPPEVPILDAKTNELLDSVGQEKRERRRQHRLAEFDLGFVALTQMLRRTNFKPDMDSFIKRHSSRSFRASREGIIDELFNETLYGNLKMSHDFRQRAADGYSYGRWDGGSSQTTYETPKTERRQQTRTEEKVPESEEVRKHRQGQEAKARREAEMRANAEQSQRAGEARMREKQQEVVDQYKMVDELARERLGKPVNELNDEELKSFYKKASRELYPDVPETGDADKFRALHDVVKSIQDERGKMTPQTTPESESKPTPQPEAQAEPPSEPKSTTTSEPKAASKPAPEPESKLELEPAVPKPTPAPASEPEPRSEADLEPKPETEAETESKPDNS